MVVAVLGRAVSVSSGEAAREVKDTYTTVLTEVTIDVIDVLVIVFVVVERAGRRQLQAEEMKGPGG